jgi:hypothetical protein
MLSPLKSNCKNNSRHPDTQKPIENFPPNGKFRISVSKFSRFNILMSRKEKSYQAVSGGKLK